MTEQGKCRKVRFATFRAAEKALDRIRAKPVDPSNFFDAYRPNYVQRCPKCRGFHLSSNEGKPHQTGKRGRNLRVGRKG